MQPLFLSPDAALALLTCGILLIYLELNRPGLVLPGAGGFLLVLLSAASLRHALINFPAALFVLASAGIFALHLRWKVPRLLLLVATIVFAGALARLTSLPRTHLAVALPCGFLLGGVTSLLTGLARHARANKALD